MRVFVDVMLVSVLFDDDEDRAVASPMIDECCPSTVDIDDWPRIAHSVALSILWSNDVLFWFPTRPWATTPEVIDWYGPLVLHASAIGFVHGPDASPQTQASRLLSDFHDAHLQPWIVNATREALLGRRGAAGWRLLLARRVQFSRAASRLRWWQARHLREEIRASRRDDVTLPNPPGEE
jgi:hypothetical protein